MILISLIATFSLFRICNAWTIPYLKTGKSVPAIGVRLAPAEDPLPQVTALIQILEKERMKVEESWMSKLEDVFNKQLDLSHANIRESVDKAMKVFEDKKILDYSVSNSLLPLLSPAEESSKMKSSSPAFRQNIKNGQFEPELVSPTVHREAANGLNQNAMAANSAVKEEEKSRMTLYSDGNIAEKSADLTTAVETPTSETDAPSTLDSLQPTDSFRKPHHRTNPDPITGPVGLAQQSSRKDTKSNGPLVVPISFLQTQSNGAGSAVEDVINKMANIAPPVVNVEVVDIFEPDNDIEDKIKEIEEKRNRAEGQLFEMATEEMEQLRLIMIQVDYASVGNLVAQHVKRYTTAHPVFRQIHTHTVDTHLPRKRNSCLSVAKRFPHLHIHCHNRISSFLQIKAKDQSLLTEQEGLHQQSSVGNEFLNPEQLSVQISASDRAYPTIDELVDEMEKKRDATERLERAKILELQLRMMRAQNEMIKDALHEGVARVLALIGKTAETIKTETAGGILGKKTAGQTGTPK